MLGHWSLAKANDKANLTQPDADHQSAGPRPNMREGPQPGSLREGERGMNDDGGDLLLLTLGRDFLAYVLAADVHTVESELRYRLPSLTHDLSLAPLQVGLRDAAPSPSATRALLAPLRLAPIRFGCADGRIDQLALLLSRRIRDLDRYALKLHLNLPSRTLSQPVTQDSEQLRQPTATMRD